MKKKPKVEPSPKVEAKLVAEPVPEPKPIEDGPSLFVDDAPKDHLSARGLHVGEILMIHYCRITKYPKKNPEDYPGVWRYEYGISDVDAMLSSLADRGYIAMDDAGQYHPTSMGFDELNDNEYIEYVHTHGNDLNTTPLRANELFKGRPPENWLKVLIDDNNAKIVATSQKMKDALAKYDDPNYMISWKEIDPEKYRHFIENIPRDRDYDLHSIASMDYQIDHDLDRYIKALEDIWHREGGSMMPPKQHYKLVDLYTQAHRFDDALKELDAIVEKNPEEEQWVEKKRKNIEKYAKNYQ